MSDQYVGEIRLFCGTYAPMDWEFCWGQTLSITSYSTLFSVIGTRYGGDGIQNFMLPDLRGRVAVGQGMGAGLTPRAVGNQFGTETVALQPNESQHGHLLAASADATGLNNPLANLIGAVPTANGNNLYKNDIVSTVAMHPSSVGQIGQGQAHNNMMPSLGINYIIATSGEFPPRD
jgi:microcystin-dependent protein